MNRITPLGAAAVDPEHEVDSKHLFRRDYRLIGSGYKKPLTANPVPSRLSVFNYLRLNSAMAMSDLTPSQALRYAGHINLAAIDLDGQERLLASRVVIIGLGGLGCSAAQYLAASGVGTLTLVDGDEVERSNLQRQILHTEGNVGDSKVASARAALVEINSEIKLVGIEQFAQPANLDRVLDAQDVVLDCCDNLATRERINRYCQGRRLPLISGAAIRFEGQLAVFDYRPGSGCYQCMSRLFSEQDLSCVEAGVLSPVVGVIGSLQAVEAIKILLGRGDPQVGSILLYDAFSADFRRINLPSFSDCPVCGNPHSD